MNPETAAALWALNRLPSERLPVVAYEWLEAGWDSPTLRILAGERDPIMSEVGPMFETMLQELGVGVPSDFEEAIKILIRPVARKIVEGAVSPDEGASEICSLAIDYDSELETNYAIKFRNLADEYDEWGSPRDELAAEILAEARKLLED